MTAATEKFGNPGEKMTLSEILFGTLLAIGAISCIWISSTLLIHLYSSLY
jgi:hypothetical protein